MNLPNKCWRCGHQNVAHLSSGNRDVATNLNRMLRFDLWPVACICVVVALAVSGCGKKTDPAGAEKNESQQPPAPATVSLVVSFPNGQPKVEIEQAWHDGMTVFELLSLAARDHKNLNFQSRGSGEMAFIHEIGGIANSGPSGKNWVYLVNDELANMGSGTFRLQPGDRVLWKFGDYP